MKKRLNILCLLVVLVLGYSVFESAYQVGLGMAQGMRAGFEEGYEAGKKGEKLDLNKRNSMANVMNVKVVGLLPDVQHLFNDSILNEKTGKYVPAMYTQVLVSVDSKPSMGQMLTLTLSSIMNLFAGLVAVVIFVFLIISINKSDIFNWKNVYRLRWLGSVLIFSFLCTAIPTLMTSYLLSDVFSVKGYSLHLSDLVSITNLVLGLSALIVGEVFAIGLRMKEEQELTI